VILADQAEASYVRYAINDLRSYLKEITGIAVSVGGSVDSGNVPVIVVGTKAARQVMGEPLPTKDLGEEGYFVRTDPPSVYLGHRNEVNCVYGI
jgi:alpha-glucuronidase